MSMARWSSNDPVPCLEARRRSPASSSRYSLTITPSSHATRPSDGPARFRSCSSHFASIATEREHRGRSDLWSETSQKLTRVTAGGTLIEMASRDEADSNAAVAGYGSAVDMAVKVPTLSGALFALAAGTLVWAWRQLRRRALPHPE